jgi:hypothetical protein
MTTLSATAQNPIVRALHRSGLLAEDLDYHVVRTSMVIMFLFFGYQKWLPYLSLFVLAKQQVRHFRAVKKEL